MGDVKLTKAEYIVGTQTLDVLDVLNKIKSDNYGAIELPMAKLDADLRKDNRIATPPDAEALRLTPPRLVVDYTDGAGIPHHIEKIGSAQPPKVLPGTSEHFNNNSEDTVAIGKRSAWGTLLQQPYDILKWFAVESTKGGFLFGLALFCALVVTWTWVQWGYICIVLTPRDLKDPKPSALNPAYMTTENFGILSKWIIPLVGGFIWILSGVAHKAIDPFLVKWGINKAPAYGWLPRLLMTVGSGLGPVGGFFFQLMIWFTVVRPLQAFDKNPAPSTK
jgi:hypothetical protein